MRFSVIIPVYKAEKYLERAVGSVIQQSFTNWEIILIDDGSPDLCPQLCDKLADSDTRIKVIHQDNGGVSVARNNGIKKAQGEIICFLDADDEWLPEYLKEVDALYNTYPDIGSSFTARWDIYSNGSKILIQPDNAHQMFILKELFPNFQFCRTSCFCIKAELLSRISLFKEKIKRGEDVDLILRAFCTKNIGYVNIPLVYYNVGTENNSNSAKAIAYFPYENWYLYNYPKKEDLIVHTTGLLIDKLKKLFIDREYKLCIYIIRSIKWRLYIFYQLKNKICKFINTIVR